MMVGAVHLSFADMYYPAMLAGRAGGMGLATAGATFTLGRWTTSRVREWSALHTGGRGGTEGAGGIGGSPVRPNGGPPGAFTGPLAEASVVRATNGARAQGSIGTTTDVRTLSGATAGEGEPTTSMALSATTTPPNTPPRIGEA
jgi:hypothetical protein